MIGSRHLDWPRIGFEPFHSESRLRATLVGVFAATCRVLARIIVDEAGSDRAVSIVWDCSCRGVLAHALEIPRVTRRMPEQ